MQRPGSLPGPFLSLYPNTYSEREKNLFASSWDLSVINDLSPKSALKPVLGTNDPQSLVRDRPGKDGQILLIQ